MIVIVGLFEIDLLNVKKKLWFPGWINTLLSFAVNVELLNDEIIGPVVKVKLLFLPESSAIILLNVQVLLVFPVRISNWTFPLTLIILLLTVPSETTSQFEIRCLANPDRLGNEMDMMKGSGPAATVDTTKYNKQFTDKLISLSSGWCKRPNADFAQTNVKPNTTA